MVAPKDRLFYIINECARDRKWNRSTVIHLLCEFINEGCSTELEFRVYLEEKIKREEAEVSDWVFEEV